MEGADEQQVVDVNDNVDKQVDDHDDDGPERPYSDGVVLPVREITQTDTLNARLLSSFDKLLSQGFKPPCVPNDAFQHQNAQEWSDDE